MTQRLPVPGSDGGDWGDVLNGFLSVAHNSDGTLQTTQGTSGGTNAVAAAGGLLSTNNLSDVSSASSTRSNLGLGSSSTLDVGTSTGTVAAGDDSRITGAVQSINNVTPNSGNVTISASSIGAISSSQVGVADGVASLDSNAHIPQSQLANAVQSFNGRVGTVIPQTGDYQPNQLSQQGAATNSVLSWNGSAWTPVTPTSFSNTTLSNGAPSSGTGISGDYDIDYSTGNIYGPKASGSWGSSVANFITASGGTMAGKLSLAGLSLGSSRTLAAGSSSYINTDAVLLSNGNGSSVSYSLPSAASSPGTLLVLKNYDQATTPGVFTISPSGSDKIRETSGNINLNSYGDSVTLFSDGTSNWVVMISNVWIDDNSPMLSSGKLQQVANTGISGFSLTSGTPTIMSWTAPNDSRRHSFQIQGDQQVTSAETGGAVNLTYYVNGVQVSVVAFPGGSSTGFIDFQFMATCDPNTSVALSQSSALTSGAANLYMSMSAQ